ncbi:MAG: hypothetical protein ABI743_00995 [bacterium]
MKALFLTGAATLLLAIGLIAPASASHSDFLLHLDDDLAMSAEAIGEITPQTQGMAELMPAIQKIREAKNRMMSTSDPASGEIDMCAATDALADAILEPPQGRGKSGTLLQLFIQGSGLDEQSAKKYVRKGGRLHSCDYDMKCLLTAVLIGLLQDCEAQKMPASVTDPIHDAIAVVDDLSRQKCSFDLKKGK